MNAGRILNYIILGTLLIALFVVVPVLVHYHWFTALGYESVFMTLLTTKVSLFLQGFAVFFVFAAINLYIAHRIGGVRRSRIPLAVKFGIVALFGLAFGMLAFGNWLTVQEFVHQVPYGMNDPIFNKDISFYFFTLPYLQFIWEFAVAAIIVTAIVVLFEYLQSFITSVMQQQYGEEGPNLSFAYMVSLLKSSALHHMGVLALFLFGLLGFKHYLSIFTVMYLDEGLFVGPGYSDIVVLFPLLKVLIGLAVASGIMVFFWTFVKKQKIQKRHVFAFVLIAYLLVGLIGPTLIKGVFQAVRVSPNEINLEEPYLKHNIEFTKEAYGLDDVKVEEIPSLDLALKDDIDGAKNTIDNVRLLDWRPLTQTYKQTQEIRLYYDLSGIDIDRYTIDEKYTQVMIAPRELDQAQITSNAQTWVNLHMVYTHGFGIVMSPVNEVTKEGLPNYLIKDIPPISKHEELAVEQPRIYYGERQDSYVLVNTGTPEFDFPKGNSNEYVQYDGKGGVTLDSFGKKLIYAIYFRDLKVLLTSDVTDESKIMYFRSITDRVQKLTPFLEFDSDPYMVLEDGHLYWVLDGFTTSGAFPYSEKINTINYIRNPVKVVINAYDGTVDYYVIDESDPILQTYKSIFPGLFKPMSQMDEGLRAHLRYPEDLFNIQRSVYTIYHMEDPKVFYNKEDAWEIPTEIYGTGKEVRVDPYYVIMQLPGEDAEEFVIMSTFTPIRKDNMVAWFAGRNDGDAYGELILYQFPKDTLVYGPLQIEAMIDQDSEISQQLTLWSQQGSSVTRGNLLVIPIGNSLIYIEPLYIEAVTGELPQLKRVIVSDGEQVVMEETLDEALSVLFGTQRKTESKVVLDGSENLGELANAYYDEVLAAMRSGNWTAFGQGFEKLGDIIAELR
ncbi:UPF0182 family protein [Candidatus Woesearchaeota archaeon]|nr:UPF0182 family protein [Candidatus Woesearchaeota archaeon]